MLWQTSSLRCFSVIILWCTSDVMIRKFVVVFYGENTSWCMSSSLKCSSMRRNWHCFTSVKFDVIAHKLKSSSVRRLCDVCLILWQTSSLRCSSVIRLWCTSDVMIRKCFWVFYGENTLWCMSSSLKCSSMRRNSHVKFDVIAHKFFNVLQWEDTVMYVWGYDTQDSWSDLQWEDCDVMTNKFIDVFSVISLCDVWRYDTQVHCSVFQWENIVMYVWCNDTLDCWSVIQWEDFVKYVWHFTQVGVRVLRREDFVIYVRSNRTRVDWRVLQWEDIAVFV